MVDYPNSTTRFGHGEVAGLDRELADHLARLGLPTPEVTMTPVDRIDRIDRTSAGKPARFVALECPTESSSPVLSR